jgi:hypothetical protein
VHGGSVSCRTRSRSRGWEERATAEICGRKVRTVESGLSSSGSFDCALRAPLRMTANFGGGDILGVAHEIDF